MKKLVVMYGWGSIGDPIFGYVPQLVVVDVKEVYIPDLPLEFISRELSADIFFQEERNVPHKLLVEMPKHKRVATLPKYNRRLMPVGRRTGNMRTNIPTKRVHPNYIASQKVPAGVRPKTKPS